MLKEMEKLMKELDKLMELCVGRFTDLDTIEYLNGTDLDAMQKCINLYKKSKELSIKMAEMMDSQNEKLDKILKLLETK